jgi:hypothetical protein
MLEDVHHAPQKTSTIDRPCIAAGQCARLRPAVPPPGPRSPGGHRVALCLGLRARMGAGFCHGFGAGCGPKTVARGADGRG